MEPITVIPSEEKTKFGGVKSVAIGKDGIGEHELVSKIVFLAPYSASGRHKDHGPTEIPVVIFQFKGDTHQAPYSELTANRTKIQSLLRSRDIQFNFSIPPQANDNKAYLLEPSSLSGALEALGFDAPSIKEIKKISDGGIRSYDNARRRVGSTYRDAVWPYVQPSGVSR